MYSDRREVTLWFGSKSSSFRVRTLPYVGWQLGPGSLRALWSAKLSTAFSRAKLNKRRRGKPYWTDGSASLSLRSCAFPGVGRKRMKRGSAESNGVLVDTNVLIAARGFDRDPVAARSARGALTAVRKWGVLPTQVLAAYAAVAIRHGRAVLLVRQDVVDLAATWRIVGPDSDTVPLALEGVARYVMSFWDAMLWATAKQHDLPAILSADGPTGTTVGGISYLSPASLENAT